MEVKGVAGEVEAVLWRVLKREEGIMAGMLKVETEVFRRQLRERGNGKTHDDAWKWDARKPQVQSKIQHQDFWR